MKKITLARIVSRLVSRFKLQEAFDEMFALSETVVPITNLDDLLRTPKMEHITTLSVTGTGFVVAKTVPANKRWILVWLYASVQTGTYTIQSLHVNDGTLRACVRRASGAGGSFQETQPEMSLKVLEPGWTIEFYVDTHSVNGNTMCDIWYLEEDVY